MRAAEQNDTHYWMNYTPETTNTQLIPKASPIPLINTIYKLNPATQNIFIQLFKVKKKNNYEKNIKFNNVIHNKICQSQKTIY